MLWLIVGGMAVFSPVSMLVLKGVITKGTSAGDDEPAAEPAKEAA
jgi:hypothetical protein